MRLSSSSPRFVVAFTLVVAFALGLGGCGKGETRYPVSGRVILGNGPLTAGQVTFVPDEGKGNKLKAAPSGMIGSDGSYSLSTDGKTGAPAGWYKVVIATSIPGMGAPAPSASSDRSKPAPLNPVAGGVQIDPKYTDAMKTDLTKEVVASPSAGAYDITIPK